MTTKRFHRNVIIFHLIFYPLFIYLMNVSIFSDSQVLLIISIIMALGGLLSMFITGIYPLYKLSKK